MAQSANSRIWYQSIILMVQWIGLSVLVQGASCYQREYSGYLFTIPDFNGEESRSQSDAQNWCVQDGSSLLEILNASVQNAVVQFINDAISQNQMTGNNIITSGRESATTSWSWLAGSPVQQGFLVAGQEGGQAYSYGYLSTNLSGYSSVADLPTSQRFYICEGKQSDCTNGYQMKGRCYQSFNSERLSWYDSRNRCLDQEGDLASFDWISTDQGIDVLNASWLTLSESYWIGLRRLSWEWRYSNMDQKYSQWSDGHPVYDWNQICLCLLPPDWSWGECSCTQSYQFVCVSASPSSASSSSSSSFSSTSSTPITAQTATGSLSNSSTQSNALISTIWTPTSSIDTIGNKILVMAVGLGVGIPAVVIIASLITVIFIQRRTISSMMKKEPAVELTDKVNYNRPYEQLNFSVPNESMLTYETA